MLPHVLRHERRRLRPFLAEAALLPTSASISLPRNISTSRDHDHNVHRYNSFMHTRCVFSTATSSSSPTSSVSSEEVSKFSSMSAQWWDYRRNPLMGMNPARMKYMLDILRHRHAQQQTQQKLNNQSENSTMANGPALSSLHVLDVGCGGGLLSESWARLGVASVTALDPSLEVVNAAKRHYHEQHPDAEQQQAGDGDKENGFSSIRFMGGMSVEELAQQQPQIQTPEKQEKLYDVICLLEVIEHATCPRSLVQAASSLLKKPHGILFVSTLNRTVKSNLLAIAGAEYVLGLLPRGTHDWNKFLSPQEVEAMLYGRNDDNEALGLVPYDVCGMVPKPCSIVSSVGLGIGSMEWVLDSKDLDVNWIGAYVHRNEKSDDEEHKCV